MRKYVKIKDTRKQETCYVHISQHFFLSSLKVMVKARGGYAAIKETY